MEILIEKNNFSISENKAEPVLDSKQISNLFGISSLFEISSLLEISLFLKKFTREKYSSI